MHPGRLHGQMRKKLRCVNVWVHVSENISKDNARKNAGFWTETLQYFESKTKAPIRQMYDMINGKWKTVRPNLARFCRVYINVIRRAQKSGVGDEDYYVLKGSPKWMDIEVPNFASKHQASMRYKTSGSGSFNKEDKAKGLKKKGSRSSGSSSSTNDKGLARLIVSELAIHNEHAIEIKEEEHLTFLEIKEREPYDHLTGDTLTYMEALKAEIKVK
ncbi:hypothetical protein Tco_0916775 [Tanacetum coccineum]